MYTIHDSRDMGCPVRGLVDDRDPAAAHRSAAALGIPEAHRIILSEPRITVDEARQGALDAHQLRLDLDKERAWHEGTREELRDAERLADYRRTEADKAKEDLRKSKVRADQLAADLAKYVPTLATEVA